MKTITIRQPWASLICTPREDNPMLGIKDIENRTWKTNFRGTVLIHAGAAKVRFDNWYDSPLNNSQVLALPNEYGCAGLPTSAIIGKVDIVDCVINHSSIWAESVDYESYPTCRGCADEDGVCPYDNKPCDEERIKPIYNWVLANPVLFKEPVLNVKGKLSFWEFDESLVTELTSR